MEIALLAFVGIMCFYYGGKILSSEERNKVFNKRPIEVVDVKKYNRFCGILVLAFGVVADVTMFFMMITSGWISILLSLLLVAEAVLVTVIYNKVEFKMLKKR